MFINLTPHDINIISGNTVTVKPSGTIARVSETVECSDTIDGVQIFKSTYGEVKGLPEPREGVWYIVSFRVADACRDRTDLLIPGKGVRDSNGNIIGCEGLSKL